MKRYRWLLLVPLTTVLAVVIFVVGNYWAAEAELEAQVEAIREESTA